MRGLQAAERTADLYNQFFTMHGITMIFLVIMPMGVALMNYLIPLMIGARDVAFPRLNAFSYWTFLFGGLFLYSSFLRCLAASSWAVLMSCASRWYQAFQSS